VRDQSAHVRGARLQRRCHLARVFLGLLSTARQPLTRGAVEVPVTAMTAKACGAKKLGQTRAVPRVDGIDLDIVRQEEPRPF
jgi:hypothetical protein